MLLFEIMYLGNLQNHHIFILREVGNLLTLVLLDPDIYVFEKVSTQIKSH